MDPEDTKIWVSIAGACVHRVHKPQSVQRHEVKGFTVVHGTPVSVPGQVQSLVNGAVLPLL